MDLAKAWIAIGIALVLAALAGLNLYQHGRIGVLKAEMEQVRQSKDQAEQLNAGNATAISSLQAAQSECIARIASDEAKRTAALSARDEAYAELALKYDHAKANLARVLDAECKEWASEPVCVASILGE